MIKKILSVTLLMASFLASASDERDITPYLNLKQGDPDNILVASTNKEDIRLKSMKDAAIYLGIQVGFNDELKSIYNSIDSIDPSLNKIFDFGAIMRSTNSGAFEMFMLPGVVEEYDGTIEINNNGRSVTTTEKRIEIVESEKMISESPNWRNYLYSKEPIEVQKPFDQILPKADSKIEQMLWKENFMKGYELGVDQANAEIIAKVQKLRRDFTGRVKYIRYTLDGKISAPRLSLFREDLITIDNEMRINERTYSINQPARFNPNTGEWEVLVLDNREGFRKQDER